VRLPRIVGHGRALDLILTGRGVGAEEALAMGLANRVVAKGRGREEAVALAHELCRFPQLCMRADRRSAYEQWSLPLDRALRNEYERGWVAIEAGETVAGATRFAEGHGRGGRFDDI
jgi:enoyl-CoA hydratase